MIMTKEKVNYLSDLARSRFDQPDSVPASGTYALTATRDSEEIRRNAENHAADFFVMGMIIPSRKAVAVCQLLQDENGMMPSPVIMLKKTGSSPSKTNTSRLAAPATSPRILEERAGVAPHEQPSIRIKDIEIIPGRHEVKVKGKSVTLTFSEFRILQTLATKPGWVFDREKIIHAVHGDHYNCTERAVDVQVTGLRKKLGAAGDYIETVRGVGYRFAG